MLRKVFLVLVLSGSAQAQELLNTLWPPRGRLEENYGATIDTDGARMVVGSLRASAPGVLFVYHQEGANWIEEARLTNRSEPEYNQFDGFGWTAEISGKRVAGSARFNAGSVCVFEQQPDKTWTRTTILPPDPLHEGGFGDLIQLDGDTLVATTFPRSGFPNDAVYVFQSINGVWTQTARFLNLHVFSVQLQGDTLALSASTNPTNVQIYARSGTDWVLTKTIPTPFGSTLALDGDTLAVSNVITTFYDHVGSDWVAHATIAERSSVLELDGSRLYLRAFTRPATVLVFERVAPDVWAHRNTLDSEALEDSLSASFGDDIAAAGSTLAVTAMDWSGSTLRSGAVVTYSFDRHATVSATPQHLSLITGGTQQLFLDAGIEFAGRPFLLGGSLAGTSPGFFVGSHHIPLQPDKYLSLSLHPGVLDGLGRAQITIELPALTPAFAHDTLHQGFVVFDPPRGIVHISNVALGALNYRTIP